MIMCVDNNGGEDLKFLSEMGYFCKHVSSLEKVIADPDIGKTEILIIHGADSDGFDKAVLEVKQKKPEIRLMVLWDIERIQMTSLQKQFHYIYNNPISKKTFLEQLREAIRQRHGIELRREKRKPAEFPVSLSIGRRQRKTYTFDLSVSGLGVLWPYEEELEQMSKTYSKGINPVETCRVDFKRYGGGAHTIPVSVKYISQPDKEGGFGRIGFSFEEMSSDCFQDLYSALTA